MAVIFEVWPRADRRERYFELAAALRPALESVDGFISIERFESLVEPGKILSLSFWRDEHAVRTWREQHREAQREGRAEVFQDYRIRVVNVVRDYGLEDRAEAPSPGGPGGLG